MRRFYLLTVLSVLAVSYQSIAQESAGTPAERILVTANAARHERISTTSEAADISVSGKVTDEKGDGLPGVSVVVKGSTQGTTTDGTGSYRLNIPTILSDFSLFLIPIQ